MVRIQFEYIYGGEKTYRAARRILERVRRTRQTSRLLRRPYSPTSFNSESLKCRKSVDDHNRRKQRRAHAQWPVIDLLGLRGGAVQTGIIQHDGLLFFFCSDAARCRGRNQRRVGKFKTYKRAASKGRRGTLAVLEYERGAILSLRLSEVGRPSGNSQSCNRLGGRENWRYEGICGGPCVSSPACPNDNQLVRAPAPCLVTRSQIPTGFASTQNIPNFCSPQQPPTSTYRSTPTHPANRQDGSPRRSPCWYEIRLLSEFPGEGYDQALDIPEDVQV